jgi:hypothetical protein
MVYRKVERSDNRLAYSTDVKLAVVMEINSAVPRVLLTDAPKDAEMVDQ